MSPPPTALWDAGRSFERVALEDIEVQIPVGVHAEERVPGRSQRVQLTIEMYRHREALTGTALEACLDYEPIAAQVLAAWRPDRPHTGLLEVLAEELVELCLRDPRVEACRVLVRKPEAFQGRATPVVEVYRIRERTDGRADAS